MKNRRTLNLAWGFFFSREYIRISRLCVKVSEMMQDGGLTCCEELDGELCYSVLNHTALKLTTHDITNLIEIIYSVRHL